MGRARQRRRAWACAALLALSFAPRAWDTARMAAAAERIGPRAVAGVRDLQPLLGRMRGLDAVERLNAVNSYYNTRIRFVSDLEAWGRFDHWSSPLELLERGEGDCEDYAIAKYFSLLAGGVPSASLRLVYARLQRVDAAAEPHMVLAWYASPDAEPLILDNLVAEPLPASRRPELTPVFSFNSDGLWQGTGAAPAGDPQARLSRWREVLNKARAEGFL